MEIKKFKTLAKREHKLYSNYVRGKINGAMHVMCDGPFAVPSAMDIMEHGTIYVTKCTQEQYDLFTKVVENWYPGLCEFDYTEE